MAYRYLVLLALSLLSALVAYFGRGYWAVDAFAANIAAGFIGSLITVFLIDRAAEGRREDDRQRIERIAMRQARLPLTQLVSTFSDAIKASSRARSAEVPATIRGLFDETLASNLNWLDLWGDAGQMSGVNWFGRLDTEIRSSCERLSSLVDKYVAFLPIETVDAIEALCADAFLLAMRTLASAAEQMKKAGFNRKYSIDQLEPLRRACLEKLVIVTELYEKSLAEPISVPDSFGREDVSPAHGSSRLNELNRESSIGLGGPPPPHPLHR